MAKDHRLGPARPAIGRRTSRRRSAPPAAPPAYVPPAAPPAPPAPGPPIFSIPVKHRDGCNPSSWRKTFTQECLGYFSSTKIEFFRTNGKFANIWYGNDETSIIIDSDSYEAPSLSKVVGNPEDEDLVEPSEGDFVLILCERILDVEKRNRIFLAALSRGFKFEEY